MAQRQESTIKDNGIVNDKQVGAALLNIHNFNKLHSRKKYTTFDKRDTDITLNYLNLSEAQSICLIKIIVTILIEITNKTNGIKD